MNDLILLQKNHVAISYTVQNRRLVIAGWTGRNQSQVQAHINELAALGVAPPVRTPLTYNISASLLTTNKDIEVLGNKTSGEAEFFLFGHAGKIWVGIGSDHTCRELEITSVAASKQVCAKPIGNTVWLLEDIIDHWDELALRSYVVRNGRREMYQSSSVRNILSPAALIELCATETIDLNNSILFCGTVPLMTDWSSPNEFVCELHDPVLGRTILCHYEIKKLHSIN